MPSPDRRLQIGIMAAAAIAGLALAAALAFRPPATSDGARAPADATPVLARIDGLVAIAEGGRVALEREALRDVESVPLALALGPEARGDGVRRALVVSVDGRRIERRTAPIDGRPEDVRLEVDADFLRPGRYLIQVDTDADGPLAIRRYVLEID